MIKCDFTREACFVYHMLSVSFCGYDNEYGKKYAALHDKQHLDMLKHHERLITVKGGVHIGELYWPFLADAAASTTPVDAYFNCFANDSGAKGEIARVMMDNYNIYTENVWSQAQAEIAPYSAAVQSAVGNIAAGLDELFGGQSLGEFYPIFVNSIDGGPEAIDISQNKHIFGINRPVELAAKFISHEYIIFRLKTELAATKVDLTDPMKYWLYIECLAAYYYELFYKDTKHPFIDEHSRHVIEFYKQTKGEYSAAQLFELAVKQFLQ